MRHALENIVRRCAGTSASENQPQSNLRAWTALVERMPDEFIDVLARGDAASGSQPTAQNDARHGLNDDPRRAG
jgi:hypothetical protein